MTRSSKITKARKLRAQTPPVTYREIGERLGVALHTVYGWVNIERKLASSLEWKNRNRQAVRATNREYRATHRSKCSRCGGDRPGQASADTICEACIASGRDRRARRIEAWWAEGLKMSEIASRLGCSADQLGVEMVKFRERGYDLPYRRAEANPRFPEQVAA